VGLLGASWEPPGSLLGAWAAARGLRRPKIAYLHVFYEVSRGPRNPKAGLLYAKLDAFKRGGNLQEGGKKPRSIVET
jgi:hypothetical protein